MQSLLPHQLTLCTSCLQTQISNGLLELTLSRDAGGARLTSLRNLKTGAAHAFQPDVVFYDGGKHPSQPPWVVRPSGQYIFHPRQAARPVRFAQPPGLGLSHET